MDPLVHALPPEALVHVLSFLSLEERMRDAALVCKAWAAAAALATPHISTPSGLGLSQQKLHALGAWLHKCGGRVVRVAVHGATSGGSRVLAKFPWAYHLPQLQALVLANLDLQPSSNSHPSSSSASGSTTVPVALAAAPAPLAGLTALTRLSLCRCICYPALGCGLSHLASLSNLRDLDLHECELQPAGTPAAAAQQHAAVFNSALLQLQQLTSLTLSDVDVDGSVLSGLSCLQRLQRLTLEGYNKDGNAAPVSVDVLPRQLTYLCVSGAWQLSSSMLPRPLEFTHLRELVVHDVDEFEPAVLGHMPQLRCLHLGRVNELSPAGVDGVRSLLEVMPQLQQLQELRILDEVHFEALPGPAAAQKYTALVSSTCLTSLRLEELKVPDGALAHMLAGDMQLPLLQQLQLGPDEHLGYAGWDEWQDIFYPPFTVRELGRLALCCPALQKVCSVFVKAADGPEEVAAAASSLRQLTALTSLAIGGDGIDDAFAAQVLAQLTQLRSLDVMRAPKLTVAGVGHLTQLQQLRFLWVFKCDSVGLQQEKVDDEGVRYISLCNQASPGDPPDVWQQLVEVCKQPVLPASLPAALVLLQETRSQLQDRDSQLQQVINQLKETHCQLQQHDDELAAAQGRITALEAQLAALEVQLAATRQHQQ